MPDDFVAAQLRRLRNDFEFYAPRVLRIKTKEAKIEPLHLNRSQRYVHAKLEGQRQATGKVRALLLKMRQGGLSTYVSGRFYHQVSMRVGQNAYIVAHEQAASDNLFNMVDRYYQQDAVIHPRAGAANAKELYFDKLDSGYKVATAGAKAVGRSATARLFHGSEVAFWPNAKDHLAGILQTIPDAAGTEVILESTANGFNVFHELWQKAEAGASEYLPIFVPWFWAEDYSRDPPPGFAFSGEELELQQLLKLTDAQLYWRHRKINDDLLGDENLFKQEYPSTATEAFLTFGDPYIAAIEILRARKRRIEEAIGALVIGVDPARYGDDGTGIIRRRGRKAYRVERLYSRNTMEVAGYIAKMIGEERPDKVFIDIVGLGVGIYDRLIEMGYQGIVVGVEAGREATDKNKYFNKRAEMWGEMKDWVLAGAEVPDEDEFQADMLTPGYRYNSNQQLVIESKDDMKKRGARSPDKADALSLTFAFPVHQAAEMDHGQRHAPRSLRRSYRPWQVQ